MHKEHVVSVVVLLCGHGEMANVMNTAKPAEQPCVCVFNLVINISKEWLAAWV